MRGRGLETQGSSHREGNMGQGMQRWRCRDQDIGQGTEGRGYEAMKWDWSRKRRDLGLET